MDIRRMRENGMTIADIARTTGYCESTVRKYVHQPEGAPVRYGPRPSRPAKLDPFKPYIMGRTGEGVFNCGVLLKEIQAKGYEGGMTALRVFVQPFRQQFRVQVARRFETGPGEQAQVDWGYLGTFKIDGMWRKVWVFAMVLGYSRAIWAECVTDVSLETLLWLHQRALRALGGVPRNIVYDNMKTVTLGRDDSGRPRWQPDFLRFALNYGFQPRLTAPYKPRSKGKVEAVIRYIKGNFALGRGFSHLADLNGQLGDWLADANRRVHATTGEVPANRLAEETLEPLPLFEPHVQRKQPRRVTLDHEISYLGTRYSVPWRYAGREVDVEETIAGRILISWHGRSIAEHALAKDGILRVRLPEHEEGLGEAQRLGKATGLHQTLAGAPEVEKRSLSAYEEVVTHA